MDPAKTTVIFLLNEDSAHPKVVTDTALVIEAILLLADIDTAFSLFEDGKCSY